MSKYALLISAMGSLPAYNDKTKTGRVLKWYSCKMGQPKEARDAQAGAILQKLIDAGVWYVQKVQVRNATNTAWRGSYSNTIVDFDKVCVHIDELPSERTGNNYEPFKEVMGRAPCYNNTLTEGKRTLKWTIMSKKLYDTHVDALHKAFVRAGAQNILSVKRNDRGDVLVMIKDV